MVVRVEIYVMNNTLKTLIVLLDLLIIWAGIKTREISRNYVLYLIFAVMLIDIISYLNVIFHDVPSFILNADISTNQTHYISVFILCLQWFAQLLFLPMLSFIHFLAIFAPMRFRRLSTNHFIGANVIVVAASSLLTVPLLTDYCGYVYLTTGHYWNFDSSKPYTYLYRSVNLVLQAVCITAILCTDSCIIWKAYHLRCISSATSSVFSLTNKGIKRRLSREARLALNFLLLSVCFLVKTIYFNFFTGKMFMTCITVSIMFGMLMYEILTSLEEVNPTDSMKSTRSSIRDWGPVSYAGSELESVRGVELIDV